MFKASVIIDEFNKYAPDILKFSAKSLISAQNDLDFLRL